MSFLSHWGRLALYIVSLLTKPLESGKSIEKISLYLWYFIFFIILSDFFSEIPLSCDTDLALSSNWTDLKEDFISE